MDVNAKQLIKNVTEAENPEDLPGSPEPGGASRMPPRRSMPPRMRRGEEGEMPGDVERVMGRGEPPGQFSPKETSQLKDVMILILASMLGSDLDRQIGEALASGKPIEPGHLQHIIDEARRANIPDTYGPLMQKVFGMIGQ